MAKAVLVLDKMPESCWECDVCEHRWTGVDEYLDRCYAQCLGKERKDVKEYCLNTLLDSNRVRLVKGRDHKPSWCPLRPLPKKKEILGDMKFGVKKYCLGWNTCLAVITGETE